jgi:hypothetical protein
MVRIVEPARLDLSGLPLISLEMASKSLWPDLEFTTALWALDRIK